MNRGVYSQPERAAMNPSGGTAELRVLQMGVRRHPEVPSSGTVHGVPPDQ